MSRDCIRGDTPANILHVLMKHVAFRAPSLSLGVSGLTRAILCSGDTRLLHTALEQGLIPSEGPIERLLELAGRNSAVRSLLLTQARRSLGCAPAGAEKNSYRLLSDDEAERVLCDPMLRAQTSAHCCGCWTAGRRSGWGLRGNRALRAAWRRRAMRRYVRSKARRRRCCGLLFGSGAAAWRKRRQNGSGMPMRRMSI